MSQSTIALADIEELKAGQAEVFRALATFRKQIESLKRSMQVIWNLINRVEDSCAGRQSPRRHTNVFCFLLRVQSTPSLLDPPLLSLEDSVIPAAGHLQIKPRKSIENIKTPSEQRKRKPQVRFLFFFPSMTISRLTPRSLFAWPRPQRCIPMSTSYTY